MTLRRLLPYLIVVVAFATIYWATMVVDNKVLYMGFGRDWNEVLANNKIPLHRVIFSFGVSLVVLLVNLLEVVTTKHDRFLLRLAKSVLTIVVTYGVSAAIFHLLDVKTLNLFYSHRGTPAYTDVQVAIFLTTFGAFVLEVIKKLFLLRFDKSKLAIYVPTWLQLERNYL